jgi:DNA-binding response OmpR family regulator
MSRVAVTVSDDMGANAGHHPDARLGKMPQPADNFPRHVLVVDDEPLIRWSVSESLAAHGYVVEMATDAASALKIVTTTALRFGAIVLDLRLPDMSDLSLLATLRQLVPDAHIIVMTAYGTPELIAQARTLGADVIAKPFELDELNRLVRARRPGTR